MHEAWEGHQQAPASGYPSRSLVTAETVKVWTWSGGAGGFSDEERRAGGWPGSGKESFRPGTENKKPLTEMSP